jgi:hypothetical protein
VVLQLHPLSCVRSLGTLLLSAEQVKLSSFLGQLGKWVLGEDRDRQGDMGRSEPLVVCGEAGECSCKFLDFLVR